MSHATLPAIPAGTLLSTRALRPPRAVRRAKPARVLIVEDNPVESAFLRGVLRPLDAVVSFVSRLRQARTELRRHKQDLVILDMCLPDGRGDRLATLMRLHNNASVRSVPILAWSSGEAHAMRARFDRAGADAFLPKPVHADVVRRVANRLLVVGQTTV